MREAGYFSVDNYLQLISKQANLKVWQRKRKQSGSLSEVSNWKSYEHSKTAWPYWEGINQRIRNEFEAGERTFQT